MTIDTEAYLRMLVLKAPILILALSIHEFFHAYTAHLCGDDTGKDQGRLSLNPAVHLDPIGTLLLFLPQSFIGWARPVPVNRNNLRNPRRDSILVSLAGPLSNLGLAIIAALFIRALAFTSLAPLPYTFERVGNDDKGRPQVRVRDVSADAEDTLTVGHPLPNDGPMLTEIADRGGETVLVLEHWTVGGRATIELPQRSETFQMLLSTTWKLLSLALFVNLGLLMFNLLPIFPLDGHHVVRELLPLRAAAAYMNWMLQYGPLLLMALLILPSMVRSSFDPVGEYIGTTIVHLARFLVGDGQLFWVAGSLHI